jgi:hypothetical protein
MGSLLAQSKQAKLRPGKSFDIHVDVDLSFVYSSITLSAMIDVNAHQNAGSSM